MVTSSIDSTTNIPRRSMQQFLFLVVTIASTTIINQQYASAFQGTSLDSTSVGYAARHGTFLIFNKHQKQSVSLLKASSSAAAIPVDGNINGGASASSSSSTTTTTTLTPEEQCGFKPYKPGFTYTFKNGMKLNIFGMYYGFMSIFLGIPWFIGLMLCQLQQKLFPKLDPTKRVPIFLGNLWGNTLMLLTRCYPYEIIGQHHLDNILGRDGKNEKRSCMFVANHCSWMDIPYVGVSVGWRNLKFVGKQELLKVPILSRALATAGHVLLDRTSRRSQLKTFKEAVQWLKDGAHLCMFAEGTRSRNQGRLMDFKGGAFKMAQSANAPIVPISIWYAHLINPSDWVFPMRSTKSARGKVIIGKPIETTGKTDNELLQEVRAQMIANLPPCQRPLDEEVEEVVVPTTATVVAVTEKEEETKTTTKDNVGLTMSETTAFTPAETEKASSSV